MIERQCLRRGGQGAGFPVVVQVTMEVGGLGASTSIGSCRSYQSLPSSCMHHRLAYTTLLHTANRTQDDRRRTAGWGVCVEFATEALPGFVDFRRVQRRIVFVTRPSTTTTHHVVERADAAVSVSDAPRAPRCIPDPQHAASLDRAGKGQRTEAGGAASAGRHRSSAGM